MATEVHPTAHVDGSARLGADVVVGPSVVIEGDVVVGDRCRIQTGSVIRRHTEMGPDNVVDPYCVLGGLPQDLHFDPDTPSYLRIGPGNVFREFVTLNRATKQGAATTIGSGGYFMTQSHVGHDCTVGDRVILANNVAVGGHCEIGDGANLSANGLVHQFCWVGELAMMRGGLAVSLHVPPFVMVMGRNFVQGVNVVGLRRAGCDARQREQIKDAYRLLYRSRLTPARALAEMDARGDWDEPARRFRDFVRRALSAEPPFNRGLITARIEQRGKHL